MIAPDLKAVQRFKEAFKNRHLTPAAVHRLRSADGKVYTVKFHGMFLPYMLQTVFDCMVAGRKILQENLQFTDEMELKQEAMKELFFSLQDVNPAFVSEARFSFPEVAAILILSIEAPEIYRLLLKSVTDDAGYDNYNKQAPAADEFKIIWNMLVSQDPDLIDIIFQQENNDPNKNAG